jgi:two-component system response regulator CpxR
MRSAGRYMTREQLAKIALGRDVDPLDRVIDVHISNLRRKLGSDEALRSYAPCAARAIC